MVTNWFEWIRLVGWLVGWFVTFEEFDGVVICWLVGAVELPVENGLHQLGFIGAVDVEQTLLQHVQLHQMLQLCRWPTKLCHYTVIFVSFYCHFTVIRRFSTDVIFVSFWCHFGVIFVSWESFQHKSFWRHFSVILVSLNWQNNVGRSCSTDDASKWPMAIVSFLCHFTDTILALYLTDCLLWLGRWWDRKLTADRKNQGVIFMSS